jgi:hypothetical protein
VKTLVHIVGNRPQFIKLSVLYEELKNNSAVRQQIIHTGQHSSAEMSDIKTYWFLFTVIPTQQWRPPWQHAGRVAIYCILKQASVRVMRQCRKKSTGWLQTG